MSFESPQRGEDLARAFAKERREPLPINMMQAQVLLAQHAFPDAAKPMTDWLSPQQDGISLAERFGAYRDAHADELLDTADPASLQLLLEKVKTYPSPTLH